MAQPIILQSESSWQTPRKPRFIIPNIPPLGNFLIVHAGNNRKQHVDIYRCVQLDLHTPM